MLTEVGAFLDKRLRREFVKYIILIFMLEYSSKIIPVNEMEEKGLDFTLVLLIRIMSSKKGLSRPE